MTLSDMLTPARIRTGATAASRRDAITMLAAILAGDAGLEPDTVRDALAAREKLGSTAIGRGVAVPHASLPGVEQPIAALVVTAEPVAFPAPDDTPVDIVFAMIAPDTASDVSALSRLVKGLRGGQVLEGLRRAATPEQAYDRLASAPDGAPPRDGG
ncbi:PTS sugar transporter subunit IIA [Glycocaulis profundi]|nr:PTS sugar transporter subunit IIA [Glycocaulis profundi]